MLWTGDRFFVDHPGDRNCHHSQHVRYSTLLRQYGIAASLEAVVTFGPHIINAFVKIRDCVAPRSVWQVLLGVITGACSNCDYVSWFACLASRMSRTISQVFEEFQRARSHFVQTLADLTQRPQNIDGLRAAGELPKVRPTHS